VQLATINFPPFKAGEKFGRSGRLGGHATGGWSKTQAPE
jgi:hypothetical protein